jgi:hypothetical protein
MSFMSTWGHGMNCFLCGMMIQAGDRRFKGLAIPERKDWAEKELKEDQLVSAPEVEETAFGKLSTQWGHFFRASEQFDPWPAEEAPMLTLLSCGRSSRLDTGTHWHRLPR